MPTVNEESLLSLLKTIADLAPAPLYPARFAKERNLDRTQLDEGLDELRKRGLVAFTALLCSIQPHRTPWRSARRLIE